MKLYRIYTQWFPSLGQFVSESFESFTIIQGQGYYKGETEHCAIVEIVSGEEITLKFLELASKIKAEYSQDEVLVTTSQISIGGVK